MSIDKIRKFVISQKPNEYFCHVYFVYKIALELQQKYGGSRAVIAAAALLHDIGREINDQPHEIVGAKIAERQLKKLKYKPEVIQQVMNCIISHNLKTNPPKTIEEKIVASSDGASQVIYASAFGLLSGKEPKDKPAWILKYIEKGYRQIRLPAFKKKIKPDYLRLKEYYQEI